MRKGLRYCLFVLFLISTLQVFSQLSPGELSSAHAHLEGMKNCTSCHILGEKETTSKCLECHTEIQQLINKKEGYHASTEVNGKKCAECHGEHFGRDFQITRFDKESFDHNLTGYQLEGKHRKITCVDCHKSALIQEKISQKKGETFLGLGTECLACHTDFHQNTLSANCTSCHNQNTFRPATGFNHSTTKFALIGKHKALECAACHKTSQKTGKEFQQFAGIEFESCTSCHKDVHENKFGNDCRKCHNEFSFNEVKSISRFNHNQTDFPLLGKHQSVNCKTCHKTSLTKALKHTRCTDCHSDYHEQQFVKKGISPDCKECHTVKGFSPSNFTIEEHKRTHFPLEGSHTATPCFVCHKTENRWNFANKGTRCIDCHENFHKDVLAVKYLPENDCKSCHSTSVWSEIQFDHNQTKFKLEGKHKEINCRNCHFSDQNQTLTQQFTNLSPSCEDCHEDTHFKQFEVNKRTECRRCHTSSNWKPEEFNHSNARFKLDGEHVGLDCVQCHKPTDGLIHNYIIYKFEDITCAACH
ncbi:hypothetical protein OU798_12040 [Prolixibacteraceae bacterium Z1-6]|uniref:Cytochrome C n=1 Tax=Draconibacterium aestuarii TaxID=2998507 RepID=A0A9X3J644_9BACT|nr:hypothetical protein [Prolixibacteraceae bacterium Z1-6]